MRARVAHGARVAEIVEVCDVAFGRVVCNERSLLACGALPGHPVLGNRYNIGCVNGGSCFDPLHCPEGVFNVIKRSNGCVEAVGRFAPGHDAPLVAGRSHVTVTT